MVGEQDRDTLALIESARAGHPDAVGQLLERYRDRVMQIVGLRLSRRRRDLASLADDIVQETLIDAFRGLDGFQPRSDGAFMHWLARLAENNVRDELRRAAARKRGGGRERRLADLAASSWLSSSVFQDQNGSPSAHAQAREQADRLEAALLALPMKQRRAIELRRLCDRSFAEIAQELALGSESSARALLSRALTELSARL